MLPKGFFNSGRFKSMLNNNSMLNSGAKRFFSYRPNFSGFKSMMNSKSANQSTTYFSQRRNFSRKFNDTVQRYLKGSKYPLYMTLIGVNLGIYVKFLL